MDGGTGKMGLGITTAYGGGISVRCFGTDVLRGRSLHEGKESLTKRHKTTELGMNKMISWTGKIVPLAVLAGVSFIFWLLKQLGCSVGECCTIIATVAMVFVTYRGNQQNKAGIEAAKMQADAAIQSLQEAQKQREETYRPRLVVYFEKKSQYSLKLLVKNIGKSPAYHIKVKCEAPWLGRTVQPDCWKYLNPISDRPTPFYTELRPGQEISLWCLNCQKPTPSTPINENYDNFFAISEIEQYLMREQPLNITIGYNKNDKSKDGKKDYEASFIANPSKAIFRHFQFDPEDTKIFSPLFTPTEADYEEMMRFIDDTVALHLRHRLAYKDPSDKVILFENTHELKGYARDLSNILPDILHGQYENCFKISPWNDLYKRFIEAVKEIWMQILRILRFQPIVDYLNGAKTSCCWDKRFPDHNSEEFKRELKELDKESETIIDKLNKGDLNANDILNLRYFHAFKKKFFECNSSIILKLAQNFPKNIKEAPDFLERKFITVTGSDSRKVEETMKSVLPKMEEIHETTHINGCEVSVDSDKEDYHSIKDILHETELHLSEKGDIHSKQLLVFIRELISISYNCCLGANNNDFQKLQEAELSYIAVKEAFKHEPDAQKRRILKGKFQNTLFKFARLLNGDWKYPFREKSINIRKEFDEILEDFKKDTAATQPTSDA